MLLVQQVGKHECHSQVSWRMKICTGCNCPEGLIKTGVGHNMLPSKQDSDCGSWFNRMDRILRVYVGNLRAALLAEKTVCCSSDNGDYAGSAEVCNRESFDIGQCKGASTSCAKQGSKCTCESQDGKCTWSDLKSGGGSRAQEEADQEQKQSARDQDQGKNHETKDKKKGKQEEEDKEKQQEEGKKKEEIGEVGATSMQEVIHNQLDAEQWTDVTKLWLNKLEYTCRYHVTVTSEMLNHHSFTELKDSPALPQHVLTQGVRKRLVKYAPILADQTVCAEDKYGHSTVLGEAGRLAFATMTTKYWPPQMAMDPKVAGRVQVGCGGKPLNLTKVANIKFVYEALPMKQNDWTECCKFSGKKNEKETCAFKGTRQVRCGGDGQYVTQTHTDGVECNSNAGWGDPAKGVKEKVCELKAEGMREDSFQHSCIN